MSLSGDPRVAVYKAMFIGITNIIRTEWPTLSTTWVELSFWETLENIESQAIVGKGPVPKKSQSRATIHYME
jgi:hypothetical protein